MVEVPGSVGRRWLARQAKSSALTPRGCSARHSGMSGLPCRLLGPPALPAIGKRATKRLRVETRLLQTIIAGLTAGAVHVLAGPDHLAAVAPLAANGKANPWRSGLYWGLGHAGGVVLVGILAILIRELLPLDRLSEWSERIVGLVLIGIGAWGIWRATSQSVPRHEHRHDGTPHAHLHVHGHAARPRSVPDVEHAAEPEHPHGGSPVHARTSAAALGVGVLHGLAGSAHFLVVLPALALPTRGAAITYVA